ncbi:DUF421 domain-containing protein [Dethiothermospora halolimnae]|uniref:DUF421 domain-containing protein n=1 Tax=Dethiothermospora halolimnae TaxID=3114390 RepID=UPI003CCBD662
MKLWIEILLRSLALFVLVFVMVRIMGKKQITKGTPFHFTSYSIIAIISALISVNVVTNIYIGFIALGVWFLFSLLLEYLSLKSKMFHDLIYGKETILIKQGKVMEENLKDVRFTGEDLLRELRSKNAFNVSDVEFAVLESTGEMNVLLKPDKKPVTPHDLGEKVAPQSESQTVILDGNIMDKSLTNVGLNRNWLITQLNGMGVSLDNVFIGQVDSSGDLYIDLFDDSIQLPQAKLKEQVYANLEKCQADLVTYALETKNDKAKDMYERDADKLQRLMNKLKPYLLK